MTLEENREIIDTCDKAIVEALMRRFDAVTDVAAYKKAHGLPILDAAREEALLCKIAALSGDKSEIVVEVYRKILEESRAYQAALNEERHEN